MAYFNAGLLPEPEKEYVCFIDIMGMQSKMTESIAQASNMVFKLHATILEVLRKSGYTGVSVYPIMDGAYITAKEKNDICNLLTKIYSNLAKDFVGTYVEKHLYLCRAAISYGQVVHGRNIPYKASLSFESRVGYKEQILIGPPMIYAYKNEKAAAPFGIFIEEHARTGAGIKEEWKWYKNKNIKIDDGIVEKLKSKIMQYFEWCENNNIYDRDRIISHKDAAKKYYGIVG